VGVRKESPTGIRVDEQSAWVRCPGCSRILFSREVKRNLSVCSECGHHFRIGARQRIEITVDPGSFQELFGNLMTADPLSFVDSKPYVKRAEEARLKSGEKEAVIVGKANVFDHRVVVSVMDFDFMGGSMGSVVGEKVTLAVEEAIAHSLPVVSFTASGGARMQEGLISLLQMAKTTGAVTRMQEKGLPFISVLTDPTTGGVAASFGMLGDIIIAEPGALIGFAGRRVIEQTINQKPPENFQKAEELMRHGMIDMIVERKQIRPTLGRILDYLDPATGNRTSPSR
jgi:acetyl-CoA carboxylase carboxyl transferase subunit beta